MQLKMPVGQIFLAVLIYCLSEDCSLMCWCYWKIWISCI